MPLIRDVHMCVCSVVHSCLTVCDPMDGSLPGSFVHWIFQARILEWVVISYSRDLPDPRSEPMNRVSSALAGTFFTTVQSGKPSNKRNLHLFPLGEKKLKEQKKKNNADVRFQNFTVLWKRTMPSRVKGEFLDRVYKMPQMDLPEKSGLVFVERYSKTFPWENHFLNKRTGCDHIHTHTYVYTCSSLFIFFT